MADPASPQLAEALVTAATVAGSRTRGGTYLAMEGPQFSTRSESMTGMPRAKLARAAELCYGSIAMATDHDCWRGGAVSLPEMLAVLNATLGKVQCVLAQLMRSLPRAHPPCPVGFDGPGFCSGDGRDPRDAGLLAKLDAVAGRLLRTSRLAAPIWSQLCSPA